jgi:hypothetical protein
MKKLTTQEVIALTQEYVKVQNKKSTLSSRQRLQIQIMFLKVKKTEDIKETEVSFSVPSLDKESKRCHFVVVPKDMSKTFTREI